MGTTLTNYPSIEGSCGGHQLWWGKDSVGHHFGCGVIAGLDGLIHRGLISQLSLSKPSYMAEAEVLWAYIRPNTGLRFKQARERYNKGLGIGVYSAGKLMSGIKKYLDDQGLKAEFSMLNNRRSFWQPEKSVAKGKAFIEKSLENNCPVHLLSWRENQEGYHFHWVTIIGLEGEGASSSTLTVATWGQKKSIDHFETFWQAKGFLDYKVMLTYRIK